MFSSASKAESRRNSSVRQSAPDAGGMRAPGAAGAGGVGAVAGAGAGEIIGPYFLAQRTPQYRRTLDEAAELHRYMLVFSRR